MRTAILVLLLSALFALGPARADQMVVVVSIGWHTGIAVERAAIDPELVPEVEDFDRPAVRWIEFGWGDAAFYQTPEPDLGTIMAAAFQETPAVMHLVGVPVHPSRYYSDSEFREVTLSDGQFDRLLAYLAGSFDRKGRDRAPPLGKGLYPDSRFYGATGVFSLSNTCNTWVARAFRAAGLDIEADGVVRASTVMERLDAATRP